MPWSTEGSLSTQSATQPARLPATGTAAASAGAIRRCSARGTVTENVEPPQRIGLQRDGVSQNLADALHDRQPEADAAHHAAARPLEPLELLEDQLLLVGRDAGAGVDDLERQGGPWRRAPSRTLPLRVYLMALETRPWEHDAADAGPNAPTRWWRSP